MTNSPDRAKFDNQAYNRRMTKTDRNAEIVRLRIKERLTFEAIAHRFGISAARVSAIVKRDG